MSLGCSRRLPGPALRVAYHSACSLEHGQQVSDEPAARCSAGRLTPCSTIPEGHICCGSAGTYNLLQPELAGQLRERKLANIASVKPDLIATGNIGCITQLQRGSHSSRRAHHRAARLGDRRPVPKALEKLKSKVHPLESLLELAGAEVAASGPTVTTHNLLV